MGPPVSATIACSSGCRLIGRSNQAAAHDGGLLLTAWAMYDMTGWNRSPRMDIAFTGSHPGGPVWISVRSTNDRQFCQRSHRETARRWYRLSTTFAKRRLHVGISVVSYLLTRNNQILISTIATTSTPSIMRF